VTLAGFAGSATRPGTREHGTEAHYNNTWVDQRVVRCKVACVAAIRNTVAWAAHSTAA
jgi:hypothetical protein